LHEWPDRSWILSDAFRWRASWKKAHF
jgi:hypothetical protein